MTQKETKVKGLAGATAMVKELEFLTGTNMGASYLADEARKPSKMNPNAKPITHEELIKHLADGGRSLYPNEAEASKAGKLLRDNIAKHLKRTGQVVKNRQGITRVLTKDRQARAGATSGLKKAGKFIGQMMLARLKAQSTTSGAPADKVSANDNDAYANRRNRIFGVNKGVVYVASRQLANALASGKVKVFTVNANVGRLLKNIE